MALGFGKRKFRRGIAGMCLLRHVAWYRVGVGRGDGCHETDSSFSCNHQKFPGLSMQSAVLTMSINERVDEAHHHDPILEISQEYLGDKVMEKMVSPWSCCSMSPYRNIPYKRGHSLQWETERESGSFGHPTRHVLFITLSVRSLSRA